VTTAARVVCRTLGVVTVIVAALFPSASAVTIFAVTTIARIERDDFVGGGRLAHDRGHATIRVGHRRWRLSRTS
jgi:hypothetical protein